MELSASLPPDLAAIADPSARGAAPLLSSAAAGQHAAGTAIPFELCLALLTELSPSGEAWPPGGKELPVALPESESGGTVASTLAPETPLFFAASPAVDLSLGASAPRLVVSPMHEGATAWTAAPPLLEAKANMLVPPAALPETSAEPIASATAAVTALEVPAEIAPVEAKGTASAASESKAAGAGAGSTPAPSWFEALASHERRSSRPPAAAASELRASLAQPPPATASSSSQNGGVAAAPGTPVQAPVQTLLRRVEVTKVLSAAGAIAEPASAARADGLPPASYGNAPNAPAAPTVTVPGPPVDVRTPHWHETFAHRVQWLASNHVDEVHIKLNPPELGAVDVKISLVDDKTFVQLTAATSAARDELAQNLPRLRELFTLSGLELGGASVHNGRDGHYAGHGQRPAAPSASTAAAYPDDGGAQLDPMPRRAVGRIDVFA